MAAPKVSYDLAGRVSLTLAGVDDGTRDFLGTQMDPFMVGAAGAGPEVRLEAMAQPGGLDELQGPAGDGVLTGTLRHELFVVRDGLRCRVPDALGEAPASIVHEPGFPVASVFATVVRPALQLVMPAGGSVAAHASSVETDAGGIAIAGWAESGKTETALALMEEGARFLSDKWTALGADKTMSAFPSPVGLRPWVMRYLPGVRSRLPRGARAWLGVSSVAAAVERGLPLRAARARRPVAAVAELSAQGLALAQRLPLAPSELRAAYGQTDDPARRVPLRALALLVTIPGPGISVERADPAWAASRLAWTAAHERRAYFALWERSRYAGHPAPGRSAAESIASERDVLEHALSDAVVLRVLAPFPTDPRPVAAAIVRHL